MYMCEWRAIRKYQTKRILWLSFLLSSLITVSIKSSYIQRHPYPKCSACYHLSSCYNTFHHTLFAKPCLRPLLLKCFGWKLPRKSSSQTFWNLKGLTESFQSFRTPNKWRKVWNMKEINRIQSFPYVSWHDSMIFFHLQLQELPSFGLHTEPLRPWGFWAISGWTCLKSGREGPRSNQTTESACLCK